MALFKPIYLKTYSQGLLREKVQKAQEHYYRCNLCNRQCGAERLSGQTGFCKTGNKAVVYGYHPHFGEEEILVGENGSGTIFFSNCNLQCNFCQNYDISCESKGMEASDKHLAEMMLYLQNAGCHNINLVTPSHVVPQILSAVEIAIPKGLSIPLIYNSSGYDKVKTLKLMDGVIDIYMPDFKFWDPKVAEIACNAPDYPFIAIEAIKEMYRQVKELKIDKNGIAQSGLLIRHLVMPNNLAGTKKIMNFISTQLSPNTYVNIMAQYHPSGESYQHSDFSENITQQDYDIAIQTAIDAGLTRLDKPKHVFHW